LPGARQIGLGKRLLERYPWWRFEPHPEWVEPHWSKGNYWLLYAGGIPEEVRFVYIPWHGVIWSEFKMNGIEPGITYYAFWFNPRTGQRHDIGMVAPNGNGEWQLPTAPVIQDWVLVLEKGQPPHAN